MNNIVPIETTYNGYRFRSRTEARWAVFLDGIGLRFNYEMEGFKLGDEGPCYLPDFWLPEIETWLEIKGPEPDPIDDSTIFKKCSLLGDLTKNDVMLAFGAPCPNLEQVFLYKNGDFISDNYLKYPFKMSFCVSGKGYLALSLPQRWCVPLGPQNGQYKVDNDIVYRAFDGSRGERFGT